MMKLYATVLCLALSAVLVGCTMGHQRTPNALSIPATYTQTGIWEGVAISPGPATELASQPIGLILGTASIMAGAIGSYEDTIGFRKTIHSLGGTYSVLGDEVLVVLPADHLFDPAEVEIKEKAVPLLRRLTKILLTFGATPILITGYTDDVNLTDNHNNEFAYERAQNVAAFLWSHGIPHQWMTVQGLGTRPDVATNFTLEGSAYNRRIEISLRRYNA